jgi:hypothetical protein
MSANLYCVLFPVGFKPLSLFGPVVLPCLAAKGTTKIKKLGRDFYSEKIDFLVFFRTFRVFMCLFMFVRFGCTSSLRWHARDRLSGCVAAALPPFNSDLPPIQLILLTCGWRVICATWPMVLLCVSGMHVCVCACVSAVAHLMKPTCPQRAPVARMPQQRVVKTRHRVCCVSFARLSSHPHKTRAGELLDNVCCSCVLSCLCGE